MNTLPIQKIASLKDFPNQLLICFNGTSNDTRLWLIQLYQSYLENPTKFTLLCVDNWEGTLGSYRADIGADLRDQLPDTLLHCFLDNIFYCHASSMEMEYQKLSHQVTELIRQLKKERNLEKEIILKH